MTRLPAIAAALIATALAAGAAPKPKVAAVRVADVFRQLPTTLTLNEEVRQRREALGVDERAQKLRGVAEELKKMADQIRSMSQALLAKPNAAAAEARDKLIQQHQVRAQEAETLKQEFESFSGERLKEINFHLVKETRASLKRITDEAEKVGREKDYDLVLDISGQTNTGLPVIIYSKELPDLTAEIIASLGGAPEGTAPTAPAPGLPIAPAP